MPLLLKEAAVRELLKTTNGMKDGIEVIARSYQQAVEGAAVHPRVHLSHPPNSYARAIRILPAMLPAAGYAALRIYSSLQPAWKAELILLYDFASMDLLAIISDMSLHDIRTAAPAGLAARYLARTDASVAGVLGSARQARSHLRAVCAACSIRQARVFSPNPLHREAFAREMAMELGIEVVPAKDPSEVIQGSDIIVTATNARAPVFQGRLLQKRRGLLLITVARGELDTEALQNMGRFFTTSYDQVLYDSPPREPFATLAREGKLSEADLNDLGDLVLGKKEGRTDAEENLLFISAGQPLWDVAIGGWIYELAREKGVGEEITIWG